MNELVERRHNFRYEIVRVDREYACVMNSFITEKFKELSLYVS